MHSDSPTTSVNGEKSPIDYSQPVAYDNQGRPLYAHPPAAADATQAPVDTAPAPAYRQAMHQYIHVTHPLNPEAPDIPPEIMQRYEESRRKYPRLNLSKGEYVILDLKRHPIGLVPIWGGSLLLIAALVAGLAAYMSGGNATRELLLLSATGLGLVIFLIFVVALIATYVYRSNRFFLTNESVIQEIQLSLFNRHEQTVSLEDIEDASYFQDGILPHLFDYGLIRLSTEGEETTYRFSYAASPRKQVAILNNAVEAFKYGRPVPEVSD